MPLGKSRQTVHAAKACQRAIDLVSFALISFDAAQGSELHMREGEDSKQDQEAKASEKEGDRTEPEQLEDKADGQQEEAAAEPTDDAEEPAAAAEEPPAKRKQDSDDKAGSKKLKNTETESATPQLHSSNKSQSVASRTRGIVEHCQW